MGTITGKFHQNPLKTVGGVAETRLTAEKLLKGHNSGKNQSSMTLIKFLHLQVMGTITGKFHQNPLRTVGVAETRLCLRTDGRTDGRTHYYSPLQLTSGDKEGQYRCIHMVLGKLCHLLHYSVKECVCCQGL